MQIEIPVSIGELIDKITILEIKLSMVKDPYKLAMVERELELLVERRALLRFPIGIIDLERELLAVNRRLWDIENFKRGCEQRQQFDQDFVSAARDVYKYNDLRADIKRRINALTGSLIQEAKEHDPA